MDLASLCSNPEKCFCWLIILLDIFAIFYLVFVSFYKVTKLVRMIGWIWIGVLITADIIILAIHPCVLTLLCILFTIMIMAAMLSVVLPNAGSWEVSETRGDDEKPKKKEKCGSYVVREIDSQKYCFELYDPQNRLLVRSLHCYLSVGDVKQAIASTRESGQIADVEDRTVDWIKEVNHPKFELFKEGAKFRFQLSSDSSFVIFRSKPFASLQECKKQLDKTIAAVASLAVYISVEKLSESDAKQYADADVIGAKDAEDAKDASAAPSAQPEPKTVEAKPVVEAVVQTAPPAQPEPKAVEATPAEEAVAVDENKEKTFWELYEALSADQKAYFDGLRNAVQAKVGVRETEYPDQLGYTVFRSNLMRIRIRKETVEAVFMLTDPAFKPLQSGVVRIINASYYRLALETLDKKYAALLEQKKERENQMRMKRSKIEDQNVPKENTSI